MRRRKTLGYNPADYKKKKRSLSSPNPGKRKIFYTIGGDKDGAPSVPEKVVSSPWNPGRCRPSKKFVYK